jgi:hypothetical protein
MLHLAREDFNGSTSSGIDSQFLLHANLGRGEENELMAEESGKCLNFTVKKHH